MRIWTSILIKVIKAMTSTIIGIPKEIKTDEKRVSLTPSAVEQIVGNGNQVFVQSTAGEGAGFDNSQYEKAGAKILDTAEEVFKTYFYHISIKKHIDARMHVWASGADCASNVGTRLGLRV